MEPHEHRPNGDANPRAEVCFDFYCTFHFREAACLHLPLNHGSYERYTSVRHARKMCPTRLVSQKTPSVRRASSGLGLAWPERSTLSAQSKSSHKKTPATAGVCIDFEYLSFSLTCGEAQSAQERWVATNQRNLVRERPLALRPSESFVANSGRRSSGRSR